MPSPQPRRAIKSLKPYRPEKGLSPEGRVICLSLNESALGPSPLARKALARIGPEMHRYPEQVSADLVAAIAEVENLDPARILPANGSDELIMLIAAAYLEPGDEAIHTQYGFLVFPQAIKVADGVPVVAPDEDMTVSVDAILSRVTPKTRVIFIANPNNPTGTLLERGEVERLVASVPESVVVVLDSAYAEFAQADSAAYTSGSDLVDKHDNVVMLRTFSKLYGLAAMRLGWGYLPPSIFADLSKIRGPFSVNSAAVAAGIAAIRDRDFAEENLKHNREWMPKMQESIRQAGFEPMPSHCNFFLIRFSGPEEAAAAREFMRGQGILLRSMVPYNLPDCLRMSLGTAEEMEITAAAFKDFASRLKDAS